MSSVCTVLRLNKIHSPWGLSICLSHPIPGATPAHWHPRGQALTVRIKLSSPWLATTSWPSPIEIEGVSIDPDSKEGSCDCKMKVMNSLPSAAFPLHDAAAYQPPTPLHWTPLTCTLPWWPMTIYNLRTKVDVPARIFGESGGAVMAGPVRATCLYCKWWMTRRSLMDKAWELMYRQERYVSLSEPNQIATKLDTRAAKSEEWAPQSLRQGQRWGQQGKKAQEWTSIFGKLPKRSVLRGAFPLSRWIRGKVLYVPVTDFQFIESLHVWWTGNLSGRADIKVGNWRQL